MRAILSTNCPAVGPRRADKPQNKAITAVRHVCHLLYASATGRAPAALSAATTARPPATSHVLCSCNHLAWRTLQTTHTHTHSCLDDLLSRLWVVSSLPQSSPDYSRYNILGWLSGHGFGISIFRSAWRYSDWLRRWWYWWIRACTVTKTGNRGDHSP